MALNCCIEIISVDVAVDAGSKDVLSSDNSGGASRFQQTHVHREMRNHRSCRGARNRHRVQSYGGTAKRSSGGLSGT